MKECPTFSVSVGFPVFGLGFTNSNELIVGGGGGAGRSGVKNKLVKYTIDIRRRDFEEDAVYDISSEEDAPMSLTVYPSKDVVVAGINASPESMAKGVNENCRVFELDDDEFKLVKSVQSLESKSEEQYQKAVRFSRDGTMLATATTDGMVHVFQYPSMELVTALQVIDNDDVLDVDINSENGKLTAATPMALKLINLRGRQMGNVLQTVEAKAVLKGANMQFRGFRYGTGYSESLAFAVANASSGKQAGGYLCTLDHHTLDIAKVTRISKKPITAFCLSADGSILAIATADLAVSLYEANSLMLLTRVKDAHSFSITSLAISPNRRMLVSASADNTCRVVELPLQFPASNEYKK
ncbi:quinon protein alcohol dehydrogenase-like superfamily [Gongronella butleri]|nr:quinon protein alcohol dehydrogenase-like superfamily [Gongronella butleri]